MIQQIKYFIYYLTKFHEFRCVIVRGCVILRKSIETTMNKMTKSKLKD